MLLTYTKDSFVEDIKSGVKIHSMREDKHGRWKAGRKIQHWRGNPRNVTKNPYFFLENECKSVQKVVLKFKIVSNTVAIYIDGKLLDPDLAILFMRNDGFRSEKAFIDFFFSKNQTRWEGSLIHWTDKKY